MKPKNQIEIKRNIYSFTGIVVVLSVLIGASSWTFMGSRIKERNNLVDSLEADTTRLAGDLRNVNTELGVWQFRYDSLAELVSSSDQKTLLEEIALIGLYLEEVPDNAKASQLNLHTERRVLERDASTQSEDLLYAVKSALIKVGTRIEGLEVDLKKLQLQQPSGGSGTGTQPPTVAGAAEPCDAEARLKAVRQLMEVGLQDRLKLTIPTLNERYFKKVGGAWDKDKASSLFNAYRDLVETIDRSSR